MTRRGAITLTPEQIMAALRDEKGATNA